MNRSILKAIGLVTFLSLAPAAHATASPAAEATVVIPATSAEIWKAIDARMVELRADIGKGALKNVHKHAFAVRDLVRGLPSRSSGLSAAAITNVTAQVPFVDTLAARLDQTGDANDKPGTEANLAKLENVLKTIRANYPAAK